MTARPRALLFPGYPDADPEIVLHNASVSLGCTHEQARERFRKLGERLTTEAAELQDIQERLGPAALDAAGVLWRFLEQRFETTDGCVVVTELIFAEFRPSEPRGES